MKGNKILLLLLGIVWVSVDAVDEFFLIRTSPRQVDAGSFKTQRDLFAFADFRRNQVVAAPLIVASMPQAGQPENSLDQPAAAAESAPRMDIVFLGAITRLHKRCALVAIHGEMTVIQEGETLENGWIVKEITLSRLMMSTEQGDMLFAVEGDEHE